MPGTWRPAPAPAATTVRAEVAAGRAVPPWGALASAVAPLQALLLPSPSCICSQDCCRQPHWQGRPLAACCSCGRTLGSSWSGLDSRLDWWCGHSTCREVDCNLGALQDGNFGLDSRRCRLLSRCGCFCFGLLALPQSCLQLCLYLCQRQMLSRCFSCARVAGTRLCRCCSGMICRG